MITEFDQEEFMFDDIETVGSVLKLGNGSLGGKGHGLAFLSAILETHNIG
jgi:hypothetical protein